MAQSIYRTHKYKFYLKQRVDDKMLMDNGFKIEYTKWYKWAVYNPDDLQRMLVINLDTEDRQVMYRYQASEEAYDLKKEIEPIKHLFKSRR